MNQGHTFLNLFFIMLEIKSRDVSNAMPINSAMVGVWESLRQVTLCSPDCHAAHYVDQDSFELTEIYLPLHPEYWE